MSTTSPLAMKGRKKSMNTPINHPSEAMMNKLEIKAMINNCSKLISPVWPLETFIACNPLQGLESKPFEEALRLAEQQIQSQAKEQHQALEKVNIQMIKWCSGLLDKGQSAIDMPHRDKGFYAGFLKLAYFDKHLHQHQKDLKQWLSNLPLCAEEAIGLCLQQLKVPEGQEEEFISQTLLYLPGWAGYVKWKTEWQNQPTAKEYPVNLTDFVAVRLVITCLLWPDAGTYKPSAVPELGESRTLEQIKQNEAAYRAPLLKSLLAQTPIIPTHSKRPEAQLVFCIDVRSEPFRRAIEKQGHYETLGFAGFFGLPIRVNEYDSGQSKDCCPVLLKPRFDIDQTPNEPHASYLQQYKRGKSIRQTLSRVYQQLKYNFSTPFALVESVGAWCGVSMLLKTLDPHLSKKITESIKHLISPPIETEPCFELSGSETIKGIALKEQIAYAETVLRLMGLTESFGKLIVLCGHGSTTENNPYASALDCGACGGNHGGTNAKLLAAIMNKQEVRQALEEKGIHIPLDTVFYGALHNTTTDSVEIYNQDAPNVIYASVLQQLILDLNKAKVMNHRERAKQFNALMPSLDIERRSQDWSETRPEWGLAKNAAFIVAPRHLSKHLNLEGRCFLHSYHWDQDTDGSLLETILTAPMVVAQWINTQYLFSTLNNVAFGSGSKVTHNVTGKIGIMQGNGSDLMHGLPLQSVMSTDTTPYHQVQRLLTVVYATRALIDGIIQKQPLLKTLFFNEWVHLVAIDPQDQKAYQLNRNGQWILAQ